MLVAIIDGSDTSSYVKQIKHMPESKSGTCLTGKAERGKPPLIKNKE